MSLVKRSLLVLIVILLLAPFSLHSGQAQGMLVVRISPPEVQQGRTALLRVVAPQDVSGINVMLNGHEFPLYRSVDGDWVGFLPADMNAPRGENPFQLLPYNGSETFPPQSEILNILWGGFLYQNIALPNNMVDLLDPQVNQDEIDTLLRVYSRYTPEKLWDGSLQVPVPGVQISEFGGIRNYNNGALEGRHTGIDFRAGVGEPVGAAGNGRVMFAGFLPIHGNHIVIDHGVGVLTGYSHLSEIYVVPGQRILAGDVIGAVGATGRVQGAHMHFEITVNGSWVDPLQFMQLAIPEAISVNVGG